jgi:dephospho-CoA kinase
MKLIGLSGTNGSGKDTVGEFLADKYGFLFVSVTDMLRLEAKKRGLPIERGALRTISAEWRREYGLGVLVDKAIEYFEQQGGDKNYQGLVMASMRNPGEADRIHELGGTMVWIDANPRIRYDRIYSRQRTAEDDKTFEQFLEEEKAEMSHSGDEATLNTAGVKDKSDIFLINEGDTTDQLESAVTEKLKDLL